MIERIAIPDDRLDLLRKDSRLFIKLNEFLGVVAGVNDEVVIESDDQFQLLRSKEVVKAFGRGFDFEDALNLVDEDYSLEVIEIREFGKSKNRQIVLKGRVIGEGGKTKKLIEKYAGVKISIYGKTISIIGKWDNLRVGREAIEMLLSGSKHSNVYRFLKSQNV